MNELLRTAEAARRLGVSPSTLNAWRAKGQGPDYVKLGGGQNARVRYRQSDIDTFVGALVRHPEAA